MRLSAHQGNDSTSLARVRVAKSTPAAAPGASALPPITISIPGELLASRDELTKHVAAAISAVATPARANPTAVMKVDEDQRMIWGWASVATIGGETVTDAQGDEMTIEDVQKMAHDFMETSRVGKKNHEGGEVGRIVESIVFTKTLQDSLGIDLGCEGWFVGYRVDDDEVWAEVKKGELLAFSFGGTGIREPIEDEDEEEAVAA